MAGKARIILALLCFGACAAAAPITAYSLAGRFTAPFDNRDEDGRPFVSTDSVSIVPADGRHAVVEIHTYFLNGSECEISGRATLEGNALVFRDPESTGYEGRTCELRIRRSGSRLTWDDRGSCSSYCGMRGRLSDGAIAWSSRRPVPAAQRARLLREHRRGQNRR